MATKSKAENEKYFAAANTYWGFKSYFHEVFAPRDFERIYIIKGGPGTGKSSLMKRIVREFSGFEYEIEEIYCSSDPNSLDGVIIGKDEKKIAILDGTAPHETDAKIPGAVDEIINLGDNWDKRWLVASKDKIESLCKEKSAAYSTAYSYLKIAGEGFDFIIKSLSSHFDQKRAKVKAEEFCREINSDCNKIIKTRLLSSFGKNGKQRLDTLENISEKYYSITGDESCAYLLLGEIRKQLADNAVSFTYFPSALSPTHIDAIYIPSISTAFSIGENGNAINAEELLLPSYKLCSEQIKVARTINEMAIAEAARWFAIASDFHFRLEEIYSEAMDFEKNDAICNKILEEIKNILTL